MTQPATTHYTITTFEPGDTEAVVDLWQRCDLVRSWNDPHKDIERKLKDSPELFFVMLDTGVDQASAQAQTKAQTQPEQQRRIIAAAMAGYEGHRGWVNYLAVDPELRRASLGRKLMEHIEQELLKRGCPKINLQVRETNKDVLAFYASIGYQVDAAVSLGKRLIPDE